MRENKLAAIRSVINYSFYIGATDSNIGELLQCRSFEGTGIQAFHGCFNRKYAGE
ncbi:MAG: hypothetical protein R2758_04680 [Bacteroidales bacterium]